MGSGQVLEQPRLDVLDVDAPWGRHQRPDLAPPDEPAATQLDARQAPAPRPASDGLRTKVDVGGGKDLGSLGQRDPVGSCRHRRQSLLSDEDEEEPDEPDEPEPEEPDPEEPEPEEPEEPEPEDEAPSDDDPEDPEPEEPELEEPEPEDEPPSDDDPEDPSALALFGSLPAAAAAAARVELEPPRSFFAQPEPLKWIAGAANCLRIDPSAPQLGQKCGPGSLIPCRMSAR
jgi:hypothetical protein